MPRNFYVKKNPIFVIKKYMFAYIEKKELYLQIM